MREDGLLAHFFVLAGFEVAVYRFAAVFQLLLMSLSLGFDVAILASSSSPSAEVASVWSAFFLVAFVSDCVLLLDILFRVCLGSSPTAWVMLLTVGTCIKEPHFLPASILRYQV